MVSGRPLRLRWVTHRCDPGLVTDWKRIESDDRSAGQDAIWVVGWVFLGFAAIGVLVGLLGSEDDYATAAVSLVLGLPPLVIGFRIRRGNRIRVDQ